MRLSYKIRIYEEAGRYVSVLVMPEGMISGVGNSLPHALTSLAQGVRRASEFGSLEQPVTSNALSNGSHSSSPPPRGDVPKVKRLLLERFGKLTLRQLSEKLDMRNVSTAVLSASIRGRGARRVRLAIARALGEEPAQLWPVSRHDG